MKKDCLYITAALLFLASISTALHAQNPLIDFLSNMGVIEGAGKRHIFSTYEDVDPIIFKPNLAGSSLPFFTKSSIPADTITLNNVNQWLNRLVSSTIISDQHGSLEDFINAHFYIDYGGLPDEPHVIGNGHPTTSHKVGFPYQEEGTNNATSKKYYLCLSEGDYLVVNSPLELLPDAYLCSCGKVCSASVCPDQVATPTVSHSTQKACTNFQSRLFSENLGSFEYPAPVTRDDEVFCQITYRDRTPPWIKDCEEGSFPTLGENEKKISTEDFCKVSELEVVENRATKVKVKMALGRIEEPLKRGDNWINQQDWSKNDETIEYLDTSDTGDEEQTSTGGFVQNVIIPNCNLGYMQYSVFLQDTASDNNEISTTDMANLNPGCATIKENRPDICYGLPEGEDLGTGYAGGARAWPHSRNGNGINGVKFNINNITGENRVHEGLIKITDNDLPNILIKITSTKDGKSLFFPPCMPAGDLIIKNSPDYRGKTDSNQGDYDNFVGSFILPECNYNNVKNSSNKPYYRIFDLKPSIFMNYSDRDQKNKFINNSEPSFINKNFRLEDQTYSDTDTDGNPDISEDNLGKRNGTWQEVVAFIDTTNSEFKIQEDVEYKFSVWFDDSVKWANVFSAGSTSYTEQIESIPSGVKRVGFKVDIPNQRPAVIGKTYSIDPEKSIKEDINIVFREPTKNDVNSIADLEANKFPSITVEAEDYAGLKRKIKLYFKVSDENANLRTLQRKHEQR